MIVYSQAHHLAFVKKASLTLHAAGGDPRAVVEFMDAELEKISAPLGALAEMATDAVTRGGMAARRLVRAGGAAGKRARSAATSAGEGVSSIVDQVKSIPGRVRSDVAAGVARGEANAAKAEARRKASQAAAQKKIDLEANRKANRLATGSSGLSDGPAPAPLTQTPADRLAKQVGEVDAGRGEASRRAQAQAEQRQRIAAAQANFDAQSRVAAPATTAPAPAVAPAVATAGAPGSLAAVPGQVSAGINNAFGVDPSAGLQQFAGGPSAWYGGLQPLQKRNVQAAAGVAGAGALAGVGAAGLGAGYLLGGGAGGGAPRTVNHY